MNNVTNITTVKGFVITLRPVVSMVAIPWAAGMVILASALYGDFQGAMFSDSEFYRNFFLIIVAIFLGVTGGYALNDYFDYRIDRANPARTDKAANHGIGQRTVLAYALILGMLSMAIWFYLDIHTFVIAIALFLCILAYSAWGKRHSPFSNLFVVAAVALVPFAVFHLYTPQLTEAVILLAVVNLFFEPGFTWSGVCKDIEGDSRLGIPTLPLKYGISLTSRLILVSWFLVVVLSLALYFSTELGIIYLVGSMLAGLWLVALAARFVREPTPEMGGSTFLKATLWLWVFSLAVILDVIFLF